MYPHITNVFFTYFLIFTKEKKKKKRRKRGLLKAPPWPWGWFGVAEPSLWPWGCFLPSHLPSLFISLKN
jgi:hypothetical protein